MASEALSDSEEWPKSVAKIDPNIITSIDNPNFILYSKPFLDLHVVLEKTTGKYYGFQNCIKIPQPEKTFEQLKLLFKP